MYFQQYNSPERQISHPSHLQQEGLSFDICLQIVPSTMYPTTGQPARFIGYLAMLLYWIVPGQLQFYNIPIDYKYYQPFRDLRFLRTLCSLKRHRDHECDHGNGDHDVLQISNQVQYVMSLSDEEQYNMISELETRKTRL